MSIIYSNRVLTKDESSVKQLLAEMIDSVVSNCSMDEEKYYMVKLMCSELIVNAVFHGNDGYSIDKKVCVEMKLADKVLTVMVEDDGKGFDHQHIGSGPKDIYSESGRGLQLIKALCDEVYFNEVGNQITVKKTIG